MRLCRWDNESQGTKEDAPTATDAPLAALPPGVLNLRPTFRRDG
jgi:hypothetical protein